MLLWHCFSFTSVWHSDVSCTVPHDNEEKFSLFLAYVVYLCLFVRVFFVICLLKMQDNLREKNISHFTLHSLPRVRWRKEYREKQQDSQTSTVAFVFRPPIHRRCGVSYFAVEARAFALVVLSLNRKYFWCETCLLCVDVCFV